MIMDELEGSANDSSLEPSIHPVSSHDAFDVISSGCVENQDGHQITSVDHAANVLPQTKLCPSENDKNRKTKEDDQQAISSELASVETRKSDVRNLGKEGGSMVIKKDIQNNGNDSQLQSNLHESISNDYSRNNAETMSTSSISTQSVDNKSAKKDKKKRSCLSLNCKSSTTNSSSPENSSYQKNNLKSRDHTIVDFDATSAIVEPTHEVLDVGSFDNYSTPSKLIQKAQDREVGDLVCGVGSFSSYTTPSKMMAKLLLDAEDSIISKTPSVLLRKRTDREKNESIAGVGSFQSFTSPSVLIETNPEENSDAKTEISSMEMVFKASLSDFLTPISDYADKLIDPDQVLKKPYNKKLPTNSSDEDEWVIIEECYSPLIKFPPMEEKNPTRSTNTEKNSVSEQPGLSFSVPAASLIARHLDESMSAPEACILQDLETTVLSENISIQTSQEELENATESLEEMKAKLPDVHNQAESENKEHSRCSRQLTDQSSLSLTPDQENILLHIFHELETMDGGPDGCVKDHVFFQKVILFIWNQRNELKDKIAELQQKKEDLDEKQTPDRLEDTLQKQLTVSENSMMETTFNETIDQLASENKELHLTIKHLEKTISALHDNNLCRLEVGKIMDHHSSNVDKKTDSQVCTLKAEFECIHQHCSLLKEELSSSKIRNENLMARLTQMEEEGQQYLEQLKTKQFQLDHLQIKFKTLEKQEQNPNMNDKTTEQLKIEEYITELEIELKEAKEQIEELKHVPKWIDHKAWNNMLSEKLKLETELIDTKEKRFEESKKLSELQQEHEDVQSKLGFAVQKSEMDGLKKKLQLEEEKMMLRVDVDGKLRSSSIKEKELKKELDEQKRIIHESEIMINQLQNNIRSKEKEVSSLNQELAILLSENVQIKQTLETITVDNNNKFVEVGALTTQLQEAKARNKKTRFELEHMLFLVSKDKEVVGQDHPNELCTIMPKKLRTDYTTKEELMINLTEARIEIVEIKHKLQTAEKNFLVEQTMNKSLKEQQAKSNEERCSLERALEVEKGIWNNTENELNKQIDKLCNEQERYMQEILIGKQDADHQKDLFIEATRQRSEISEKYEGQLNDIKKQWGEEKTDLEKQRDLLKEEAQQMKKMVMEKEGRIYTLEDSVKRMKKDKRQNIDLRTKLASTKTSLRDMDTKMEKLSIERDGYVKETAELKKTLHNAEDNEAILESHISEKEKTLYGQTVRYSCLNSQLQKTQNSLATVHEGLKNSKDYNASLLKERSDLQAKLESLREAWEDDKTKLALIQESFTNTESKHEKTVEMLNEVQESNNSLNSSLLDLDSKYSAELAMVKILLEHESELETKITSYDMRVNILNEQVAYYKNRLKKEELRLHRAREDILQNNNETMYEKQNVIDDLNNENKILVKENARLKQDLTTVMKCMEEQKIEFSKIQSSAYDNDVKQRERQWKVEQLTKELLIEKQIQQKLEKSCNDKDQELCSVKKQILAWEEKQKEVKSKHFKNDRNSSDQSIVDLEIMIKKLRSEVKSIKSVPQENDCDDKKKIRELEWKLHVLHMQRLADQETIGHLQDNLKDVISKFSDRRDGVISSKNDRTSAISSDICQALTRAQVRAYAMNLNESPLYLFENSQHGGLQAPDFSFKSTNMRTSTPNHSRPTP